MKTTKHLGRSFRIKNRIFPRSEDVFERIHSRAIKDKNGCWNWFGSKDKQGYGCLVYKRKFYMAHRLSYQSYVGKIGSGLQLDHLCRNKSCINPKHLEPVTQAENLRRAVPTHCKRGHDLNDSNVYHGRRNCRTCNKERSRVWRETVFE